MLTSNDGIDQGRSDAPRVEPLPSPQRAADSKDMTLMDAAREAIRRWVMEETGFGCSPLFNFDIVLGKGRRTDSSDDDTTLRRSEVRPRRHPDADRRVRGVPPRCGARTVRA